MRPGDGKNRPPAGFSALMRHLDRVAAPHDRLLIERQRHARRHADLLGDEVDASHHFGDWVLDLQPGVHLEEEELAVRIEELHSPGVVVADRPGDGDRRLTHRATGRVGQQRRGALLDELLVAALGGAVALTDPHHVPVRVTDDLHLDVSRPGQVALDVDLGATEVRLCFALRRLHRRLDGVGPGDHLHAATAAPVGSLHRDRPPVLGAERAHRRRAK